MNAILWIDADSLELKAQTINPKVFGLGQSSLKKSA